MTWEKLSVYLRKWRLKLSTIKITTTAFHLNNRDANKHLAISVNGARLPNNDSPVYLGVTLDHSLTYKNHLESLRRKVNTRNGLLLCLAGSSWGAYTWTLPTGALALVCRCTSPCLQGCIVHHSSLVPELPHKEVGLCNKQHHMRHHWLSSPN